MTETTNGPSLLQTDAYKLSMAQAGFCRRQEVFYFSFRKGGWHYVPFDLEAAVRATLPALEQQAQLEYAAAHGYGLSAAMIDALHGELEIHAVPAGTWVGPREPLMTIVGPSFLVSWLEPLVLRMHHAIQVATQLQRGSWTPVMGEVVGAAHAQLVAEVADAVGVARPELHDESQAYVQAVQGRGQDLVELLEDPSRIFEVGMRAAVTEQQHRLALQALKETGVRMTSNVALAFELGLKPVGTMGHEHVQRWGADLQAFRAMRDMRLGVPSYLLDTFDTIRSGIPRAIQVMREQAHACSIRYDSGDKFAQYMYAHGEFSRAGLEPVHILEDGLGLEDTQRFEALRAFTELPPQRQLYGYGGHLVARPATNPLTRDRVAAVYKLSESSGEARMKFGNEAGLGKRSVPGRPIIWRRLRGQGPLGVIAQLGEEVPEDYIVLNGNPAAKERLRLVKAEAGLDQASPPVSYHLSERTRALEAKLERDKRNADAGLIA